jgi:D-aminoacyl-tRNA deacylase
MRAVVQRVSQANLTVEGVEHCAIGPGMVLLAGFAPDDDASDLRWMADKVAGLRIFPDDEGKMNRSVGEVNGEILAVPNFTLYGDCRRGRRPGFSAAAPPESAARLFDRFCSQLGEQVPLQRGVFGAHMHVALVNDGPVTLLLDSKGCF